MEIKKNNLFVLIQGLLFLIILVGMIHEWIIFVIIGVLLSLIILPFAIKARSAYYRKLRNDFKQLIKTTRGKE